MKDNRELGYVPPEMIEWSAVCNRLSCLNGGGTLTMHADIGQKGKVYRVYGYLWHNDQDASREGIRGECCARGSTADEAIHCWAANASDLGWFPQGIAQIKMEMLDALAELEGVS